jgi:hypothetical protein
MCFHVFIAREGFKETPIDMSEWIAVAHQRSELSVTEQCDSRGRSHYSVHLRDNKRDRLSLTPYGLIDAQNPSRDLVVVMLALAEALNARVYSERLKPYTSIDDWERRTKSFRQELNERKASYLAARWKRIILAIIIIVVAALIGWFVGGKYEA